MRAPPSFSGYQIFAALVPCELCLQLRGHDDPATALPACVVGGSPLLCFSLLSLYRVSLDTLLGLSKQNSMCMDFLQDSDVVSLYDPNLENYELTMFQRSPFCSNVSR